MGSVADSVAPKIRIIIDNTNFLERKIRKVEFFDIFIFNNVKSGLKVILYQPNKVVFKVKVFVRMDLTNCLPPSRLTSLNIGCTRHSQASLTLLSFARYFGITQTSLTLSSSVTTRDSPSKLGLSSRCSIGWVLLSLLRRLQIPVNTKTITKTK